MNADARDVLDDPAALTALRGRLLRYASRSLSQADAEDVTQETLLALLSALDHYRGAAHIDTYCHAVLRHKTVDVYRAHGRESPCAPETLQAAIDRRSESSGSAPDDDPAQRIDARRQAEKFWTTLQSCLRELPQQTRAVFELRTMLELDLPVVCRHLGITRNHGSVLAHRARMHIRRRWPATHAAGASAS